MIFIHCRTHTVVCRRYRALWTLFFLPFFSTAECFRIHMQTLDVTKEVFTLPVAADEIAALIAFHESSR